MATNLPRPIPDLLAWAQTHDSLWQANFAAIGLSTAQATAFKNLVASFRAAFDAAEVARLASKNATETLHASVTNIRATGGAYVNLIKAFAETTHNPAVYTLSGISPDDPAGTVAAPIPPDTIIAGVNADGSLTLKWKVGQPDGVTGVQYLVSRRLGSTGTFALVGSVGAIKTYVDATLPFGVDSVQYIITPKRGDVMGDQSAVFTLQFGSVRGGGNFTITSSGEGNASLAA
jgi:hypothetical protein